MKERILGLGFHGEGPTDHRFLAPLLERITAALLTPRARYAVRINPPVHLGSGSSASRASDLSAAYGTASESVDLLFIHADGAGDAAAVRAQVVQPLIDRLSADHGELAPSCVPVVPVREMEAWIIADPATVAGVLRSSLDADGLGLPRRARDAEQIPDPKALLETAVKRARSRTRRRNARVPYEPLAERTNLDQLRELAAVRQLTDELSAVLEERWVLPAPGE